MTSIVRTAVASALLVGLSVAAHGQSATYRVSPQSDDVLYSGRSVYEAPVSPSESSTVMGLRVPGGRSYEAPGWTARR